MTSELLWECCIFLHAFLHDFATVLTVWYFFTCFSTWFLNTTLLAQFRNPVEKYHTVRIVLKSCRKISNCQNSLILELFWQCGIFLHDFGTALTVLYFSTGFSTWFLNCSDSVVFFYMFFYMSRNTCRTIQHFQSSSEIMSKNTILSEQFRNHVEKHVEKYNTVRAVPKSCRKIPHCQNSSEIM
jgi:hypothetical protein